MKVRWLGNACIEIHGEQNILIDPNYLTDPEIDPDIILVTHEHSDHIAPQKLERFDDYQLYAPSSVFDEYDLDGETIQAGDTIAEDIQVIGCDCYGSEGSVCYYYKGLYHTADASDYKNPGDVKLLFTACFSNLYDDYLESIEDIQPDLTVPYHIDPNDEEDLEEAQNLQKYLEQNDIQASTVALGEIIEI